MLRIYLGQSMSGEMRRDGRGWFDGTYLLHISGYIHLSTGYINNTLFKCNKPYK